MKPLEGTAAIVTGASSGIGEATALSLARLGASIALLARRVERLERVAERIAKAGGNAMVIRTDVTNAEETEAAVRRTLEKFRRIDTLINNAGVMFLGPVAGAPAEEWGEMTSVNVNGLLNMTRAALPHLLDSAAASTRGAADIVNISSISGRRGYANAAVYGLTKFAVSGFSEALRQEVTKKYVRVSTVEPGIVTTELPNRIRPEIREARARALEGVEVLAPDDVAELIAFIVTRPRHVAIDQVLVRPTLLPT